MSGLLMTSLARTYLQRRHVKVDMKSITPKESRRVELCSKIGENDARAAEELAFAARPLIQATLPHSRTAGTNYVRRNGNLTLEVRASADYGLPYGVIPRVLIIWMTSEACRKKSRTLEMGKNLSEFMRKLDIPIEGRAIAQLKKQMDSLFTSVFYVRYNVSEGGRTGLGHELITPVKNYICWDTPKDISQPNLFPNELTLFEDFYKDIISLPVPVDLRAIRGLRKSPMAVDIYEWLTLKNYYAKRPTVIPWDALQFQFGAGYPNTTRGRLNFKAKFKAALVSVGQVYEDAKKLRPETEHLLFIPGRPHVLPKG